MEGIFLFFYILVRSVAYALYTMAEGILMHFFNRGANFGVTIGFILALYIPITLIIAKLVSLHIKPKRVKLLGWVAMFLVFGLGFGDYDIFWVGLLMNALVLLFFVFIPRTPTLYRQGVEEPLTETPKVKKPRVFLKTRVGHLFSWAAGKLGGWGESLSSSAETPVEQEVDSFEGRKNILKDQLIREAGVLLENSGLSTRYQQLVIADAENNFLEFCGKIEANLEGIEAEDALMKSFPHKKSSILAGIKEMIDSQNQE